VSEMFLYFKQTLQLVIQVTLDCVRAVTATSSGLTQARNELSPPAVSAVNISHFSGILSPAAADDSCTCSELQLLTVRPVIYSAQRTQR
jgi:hypothetical protein